MTHFKNISLSFLSFTVLSSNGYSNEAPVHLDATVINASQADIPALNLNDETVSGAHLNIELIDLPASMDIFDQDLLRQRGARTTLEAVEGAVGALSGNPPGAPGVHSMRGFSGNDISHLHNGIRITSPGMSTRPLDTFNLERVEVLKGPASVLYGDGALAGAINFVSKQPSRDDVESEFYLSQGSFNTQRVGFGSGGTTDLENLYYRVDVSQQNSDGYVDRSGFEYKNYSGSILYDFGEVEVSLEAEFTEDDIEAYFGHHEINGRIPSQLRTANFNIEDEITKQQSHWLRAVVDWKPNASWEIKNVIYQYEADRHWRNAEDIDEDTGTFAVSGFFEVIHDQEILGNRFESTFSHQLSNMNNQVLIGFDMNENRFTNTGSDFAFPDIVIDPFNPPALVFADGGNDETVPNRKTKATNLSFFIEDQLEVTNQLILLLGLRYDDMKINSDNLLEGETFSKSYQETTGRFGTTYKVTNDFSVYGQYATSIVPIASLVTLNQSAEEFDLAKGEQVELGFKQRFLNNRGQWTTAIYDITKKDGLTPDPDNQGQKIQVGEQSSQGIESSLALQMNDQWLLEVNASFLKAEFEVYNIAGTDTESGKSPKGNTPANVAEKTANLWIHYQANEKWKIGGASRYVGEREMDDANYQQMDAYSVSDLYVSWKTASIGDVTFRIRNVFDEEYSQWSVYDDAHLLGDPRSYEISLYRKF